MGLPKVGMRADLPTAQNRQRLPLTTSPVVGEGYLVGLPNACGYPFFFSGIFFNTCKKTRRRHLNFPLSIFNFPFHVCLLEGVRRKK